MIIIKLLQLCKTLLIKFIKNMRDNIYKKLIRIIYLIILIFKKLNFFY